MLVRGVLPWNVQSDSSVGATAPTKLKMAAPSTPGGRPRRVGLATSRRRRRAVVPMVEIISSAGGDAGGGIGVGSTSFTVKPSSERWVLVVPGNFCTMPARSLALATSKALAVFFVTMAERELVPSFVAAL